MGPFLRTLIRTGMLMLLLTCCGCFNLDDAYHQSLTPVYESVPIKLAIISPKNMKIQSVGNGESMLNDDAFAKHATFSVTFFSSDYLKNYDPENFDYLFVLTASRKLKGTGARSLVQLLTLGLIPMKYNDLYQYDGSLYRLDANVSKKKVADLSMKCREEYWFHILGMEKKRLTFDMLQVESQIVADIQNYKRPRLARLEKLNASHSVNATPDKKSRVRGMMKKPELPQVVTLAVPYDGQYAITARITNVDDKARIIVNGQTAVEGAWDKYTDDKGQRGPIGNNPGYTDWMDITSYFKEGDNKVTFWQWNSANPGSASATFEVKLEDELVLGREFFMDTSSEGVKYKKDFSVALNRSEKPVDPIDQLAKRAAQLEKEGQYDQALMAIQKAIELKQKATPQPDLATGIYSLQLARLSILTGRREQADTWLLPAIGIINANTQDNDLARVDALYAQGLYQYVAGQYAQAQSTFGSALEILGDRTDAEAINRLTLVLAADSQAALAAGALAPSMDLGIRAVDAAGSTNDCSLAQAHDAYGRALRATDRWDEAQTQFETAIDKCQQAGGAGHPLMGRFVTDLGALYVDRKFLDKSQVYLEEGLGIRKATLGENHYETAESYMERGRYYLGRYMFREALADYDTAQNIYRNTLGEGHWLFAACLIRKAELYLLWDDFPQAESFAASATAITRNAVGENGPTFASCLAISGRINQELARFDLAEKDLTRSLEIHKAVFGEKHFETGISYKLLGDLYLRMGRHEQAKEMYAAYAANCEPETRQAAAASAELAKVDVVLGNLQEAEERLEQVAGIQEKVLGEDSPELADTFIEIAKINVVQGDTEKARENLEKAVDIQEKALGSDSIEVSETMREIATLAKLSGDFEKAIESLRKAIEIQKQKLGDDHWIVVETEKENADLLKTIGQDEQAEDILVGLQKTVDGRFGDRSLQSADIRTDVGEFYVDTYQFVEAEKPLEEALAIKEKSLPDYNLEVAEARQNLAVLYEAVGREDEAAEMYEKVLDLRRKVYGETRQETADAYENLGLFFAGRGDTKKAEENLRKALTTAENMHTPDGKKHFSVADKSDKLARLFLEDGQIDLVEPLVADSLAIREDYYGENHPAYARSLFMSSLLAIYKGDHKKAEKELAKALEIQSQFLSPEHGDLIETNDLFAMIYWQQGKDAKAEKSFDATFDGLRLYIVKNFETGMVEEGIKFLALHKNLLYRQVSFFLEKKMPAKAYDRVVFLKGLFYDSALADKTANRINNDPALKAEFRQLRHAVNTQSSLFNSVMSETDPERRKTFSQLLQQWNARLAEIDRTLAQKNKGYARNKKSLQVTSAEVQAKVPDGALYLDYFSFAPYSPETKGVGRFGEPILVGFAVDKDSIVAGPALEESTIDRMSRELLNQMSAENAMAVMGGGDEARQKEEEFKKGAFTLYQQVFMPFKEVEGKSLILVSGDGMLSSIPFDILVNDRGEYLIRQAAFGYEASARELVRAAEGGQPAGGDISLLIGNPDFDLVLGASDSAAENQGSMHFGSLAETGEEVVNVSKCLDGQCVLLNSDTARETAVKEQAEGKRLLYFATHGYVLEPPAAKAGKQSGTRDLTLSSGATINGVPLALVVASPLNLCGLALTGANSTGGLEEDGKLTGMEVIALNLQDTRFVVLSACKTGYGHLKDAQGLVGLRYAFTLSGAQTIVASAWSVPSMQTKELMEAWIPEVEKQGSTAVNLRKAKLAEIGIVQSQMDSTHPMLWGAFTVSGMVW